MGMVVLDASLSDYYQNKIANDCVRLGIPYLLSFSKRFLPHIVINHKLFVLLPLQFVINAK